jgi:hypothetical protein
MYVRGFLCVSLGSNTIQLHNSLGNRRACACSEASFSSKNCDCAWGVFYRRTAFCYAFLWAKGFNAKDIHKKCFLFTVGSVYGVKRFISESRNSLKDVRKLQMMPDQERKWLKQQPKDFYAAGFDALVKRWGKCINVGWRICRETNVFIQVRIKHVLRFISICDLFTDSSSYTDALACNHENNYVYLSPCKTSIIKYLRTYWGAG